MTYHSKDFANVGGRLATQLPAKLIHKNLRQQQVQSKSFSKIRNHFVSIVDLPAKTISMTLGGLVPGQTTRRHRHNYETLIYIIKGYGQSVIEDQAIVWEAGDAIYVPVWAWHQHINTSKEEECYYVACENAPLLLNIGNIGVREELDDS